MGKGGYFGGGTIIGPNTPGWFSGNSPLAGDSDAQPSGEAAVTPAEKKAMTRNERRKRARGRGVNRPAAPQKCARVRKPLTTLAESRISKLSISIIGLDQQIKALQRQLDADRAALRELLEDHGLPLDRYPVGDRQ